MAPGSGIVGSAHDFARENGGSPCSVCHLSGKRATGRGTHGRADAPYGWTRIRQTMAGTRLPTNNLGGPTAMCLSCHDGMIANSDRRLVGRRTGAAGYAVAFGGALDGSHPVSVPYPAGGTPSVYRNLMTGTGVRFDQYVPDPTKLGILLYRDNGDGTVTAASQGVLGGNYGIECSSCHDVHNGPSVRDRRLVRGTLSGSTRDNICFSCHTM